MLPECFGNCHMASRWIYILLMVPFKSATSIYAAYRMHHSMLTLLVSSTSCFLQYLPTFACRSRFHHSGLSFPNQYPPLGCICREMVEVEAWELNITLHHTSHGGSERTRKVELFFVVESENRVGRYHNTWLCGSTRSLLMSECDQQIQKMECIIDRMIRWYEMRFDASCDASNLPCCLPNIYPLVPYPSPLPLYLWMPLSPSRSAASRYFRTPASTQSMAKQIGCGGENWIFQLHFQYSFMTSAPNCTL
jgi:hypothetical protein